MLYRLTSFLSNGNPMEYPTVQVIDTCKVSQTVDEVKDLARAYYLDKKKDERVKSIEIVIGENLLKPIFRELYQVNQKK